MQSIWRKVTHATLYELIAITIITPLFALFFHKQMQSTLVLSIIVSVIALLWNIVFNYLFEAFERKIKADGRSFWIRVLHAVAFEIGLIVFLVPLFAYWFDISLLEAFLTDFVLLLFFLLYTFLYNLAFDYLFGLPIAEQRQEEQK